MSEGISPELLRWKGIEATLKLAESPNAKVVMVRVEMSAFNGLLFIHI